MRSVINNQKSTIGNKNIFPFPFTFSFLPHPCQNAKDNNLLLIAIFVSSINTAKLNMLKKGKTEGNC
jgi:hypothetical protein